MLRLLDNVRAGISSASSLKTAETTRRSYELQLSAHRDVERVHTTGINTLSIDPIDGQYLLSGCGDGSIYIHDLYNSTGLPKFTAQSIGIVEPGSEYSHKHSVECIRWYPIDTGMFVSSGMDFKIKIWDTNLLKPVDTINLESQIYQHDISDRCLIAVASTSQQVKLVDMKTGSFTHELRGHTNHIISCKWSTHQDNLLATGGADNRVMLWDVRAAKSCLLSLDQHNRSSRKLEATAHDGQVNSVAFTEDGLFILSFGTDSKLKLWSALTGRKEMVNYGKIPNKMKRCSKEIAVTSDANPSLVYVPSEASILVYEIHTGTKVGSLLGHYNVLLCCAYQKHHHEVYSAGKDMVIIVWTPDFDLVSSDLEEKQADARNEFEFAQMLRRNTTRDAWSSDED